MLAQMAAQAAAHEAAISEERRIHEEGAGRGSIADGPDVLLHSRSFGSNGSTTTSNAIPADSGSGSGNSSCEQIDKLSIFISSIRDLENIQT